MNSNLESLSGSELDKYGKSQGIPRYQGLMGAENDVSYRDEIRKELFRRMEEKPVDSLSSDSSREFFEHKPLLGVFEVDAETGKIIKIVDESNSIYLTIQNAKSCLDYLAQKYPSQTFEIRKVGMFVNNEKG